jgi:hypothetical protein
VQGYILRLSGGAWTPDRRGRLPNEFLYGFVAVMRPILKFHTDCWRPPMTPSTSAATTEKTGGGHRWGYPRRPPLCRISVSPFFPWEERLVLGTFGRSMWVAELG